MKKVLTFFSLFGSMSTLLCCALPVTLVTVGMGATFASLTSNFPQVIWLVERKAYLFIITGALLIISFFIIQNSRELACPVNASQKEMCQASKSLSEKVLYLSAFLYLVGVIFSYIIPIFM